MEAIKAGTQPGLTMVVGPPGTGKTDTAVQIMHVLYHNCPAQRTLLIAHSNQVLLLVDACCFRGTNALRKIIYMPTRMPEACSFHKIVDHAAVKQRFSDAQMLIAIVR